MKKAKNLAWKGIYYKTYEKVEMTADNDILFTSSISGSADKGIVDVQYSFRTDKQWRVSFISLSSQGKLLFQFEKHDAGWFDINQNLKSELKDCIDIDISLSPLTNTLPVKRLYLQPGDSADIHVLYLDVLAGTFRAAPQRYTRLDNHRYRFEGLDIDFQETITFDDDGFVTDYSGLFKRM